MAIKILTCPHCGGSFQRPGRAKWAHLADGTRTAAEIAVLAGVTRQAVFLYARRHGVPLKKRRYCPPDPAKRAQREAGRRTAAERRQHRAARMLAFKVLIEQTGCSVYAAAEQFGLPRQTGYNWAHAMGVPLKIYERRAA